MICKGQIDATLSGVHSIEGNVNQSGIVEGTINKQNASLRGELLSTGSGIDGSLSATGGLEGSLSIGMIVGGSYEKLKNKPKINSVELIGNKSGKQLSLIDSEDLIMEYEIDQIIFGGLG